MRSLVLALYMAVLLVGATTPASGRNTFGLTKEVAPTVVHKQFSAGEYVEYLPKRAPRGILVIAHGSVEEERSEQDLHKLAESFVRRWTRFADDHRLIVLAPIF
jgi:poly(3-hydroxybutyrate) depolymerase